MGWGKPICSDAGRGGYHPPAVSFKMAHLIRRRSTRLRGRGGACSSRRFASLFVGVDSISTRRRLSEWLPPGWEQGAVASPQRPAPQGCLKEKAQSKEDISVPTEENRGKHLIKGKSLLSSPPAPSTASRSPSLPEGGRKECPSLCYSP